MAALPNILGKPAAEPDAKLERLIMMLFFSILGFALIGWNAYTIWRNGRKQ
jgi:hypothetical protein